MANGKGVPAFGIILLALGMLLLLDSLDAICFHWSYILIGIGAIFCVMAFASEDKGVIFPGVIIGLIGLFFLMRRYGVLEDSMADLWPVFPIIVGIAFLTLYIFRPSDVGLLFPAGIMLFFGVGFLAYNYMFIDLNPARLIGKYWPLILIAIGVKMILNHRGKQS